MSSSKDSEILTYLCQPKLPQDTSKVLGTNFKLSDKQFIRMLKYMTECLRNSDKLVDLLKRKLFSSGHIKSLIDEGYIYPEHANFYKVLTPKQTEYLLHQQQEQSSSRTGKLSEKRQGFRNIDIDEIVKSLKKTDIREPELILNHLYHLREMFDKQDEMLRKTRTNKVPEKVDFTDPMVIFKGRSINTPASIGYNQPMKKESLLSTTVKDTLEMIDALDLLDIQDYQECMNNDEEYLIATLEDLGVYNNDGKSKKIMCQQISNIIKYNNEHSIKKRKRPMDDVVETKDKVLKKYQSFSTEEKPNIPTLSKEKKSISYKDKVRKSIEHWKKRRKIKQEGIFVKDNADKISKLKNLLKKEIYENLSKIVKEIQKEPEDFVRSKKPITNASFYKKLNIDKSIPKSVYIGGEKNVLDAIEKMRESLVNSPGSSKSSGSPRSSKSSGSDENKGLTAHKTLKQNKKIEEEYEISLLHPYGDKKGSFAYKISSKRNKEYRPIKFKKFKKMKISEKKYTADKARKIDRVKEYIEDMTAKQGKRYETNPNLYIRTKSTKKPVTVKRRPTNVSSSSSSSNSDSFNEKIERSARKLTNSIIKESKKELLSEKRENALKRKVSQNINEKLFDSVQQFLMEKKIAKK